MINQQLKGRFESQRAFLGIYKEAFVFCGGRADKTEYKAKKLISRSVEFQRRSHFLTRQACVPRPGPWAGKNETLTHRMRTPGSIWLIILKVQILLTPLGLQKWPLLPGPLLEDGAETPPQ